MLTKSNLKFNLLIIISAIFIGCQTASGLEIIYVDSTADPCGIGLDWTTAYRYLPDAIADANIFAKPVEIWVAEGTYKPDQSEYDNATAGDSNDTFQLINGVSLYGAFPQGGWAGWLDRDPDLYPTILNGDLLSDDTQWPDPEDMLAYRYKFV